MRSSASSEPALQTPYAAGLTTFAFIQSRQGICALSNLCVQHKTTYSRLTGDGAQSGNPAVAKIAQSAKSAPTPAGDGIMPLYAKDTVWNAPGALAARRGRAAIHCPLRQHTDGKWLQVSEIWNNDPPRCK